MSKILDELHHVIADLEAEGHHMASRLHDVADHIKADIEHLAGGSRNDLERLAAAVAAALAPELHKAKAEAAAEGRAFLAAALGAVEPVIASNEADAKKAFADAVSALRTFVGGTATAA